MNQNKFAFPHSPYANDYAGMTLLDYFAGQALAGILANQGDGDIPTASNRNRIVEISYDYAKRMLVQRETINELS